jgi:hypothetical protein
MRKIVIRAGITAVALALGALLLPAGTRQWREYQFRSLSSIQHYDEAQILLHPQTKILRREAAKFGVPPFYTVAPSASGLREAIRHMEAITPDFPKGYRWAAEVLPYLRVERDRPQDLPAMLQAIQQACSAKIEAALEAEDAKRGRCSGILDAKSGKCLHSFCGNACLSFQTDRGLFRILEDMHQPLPDGMG